MRFVTNPLAYLLAPVFFATVYCLVVFGAIGSVDSAARVSAPMFGTINWPTLATGAIWISLFTGGLVGVAYHLRNLLSKSHRTTEDFSKLSVLSRQQEEILRMWVADQLWEYKGKTLMPGRFSDE